MTVGKISKLTGSRHAAVAVFVAVVVVVWPNGAAAAAAAVVAERARIVFISSYNVRRPPKLITRRQPAVAQQQRGGQNANKMSRKVATSAGYSRFAWPPPPPFIKIKRAIIAPRMFSSARSLAFDGEQQPPSPPRPPPFRRRRESPASQVAGASGRRSIGANATATVCDRLFVVSRCPRLAQILAAHLGSKMSTSKQT